MTEVQWFRLLLLAVGIFFLGGAGTWSYNALAAHAWSRDAARCVQDLPAVPRPAAGFKADPIVNDCARALPWLGDYDATNSKFWGTLDVLAAAGFSHDGVMDFAGSFRSRADAAFEYSRRADTALWFVWLPEIALVFLFYALRWAMMGRLRPLWLLGRQP